MKDWQGYAMGGMPEEHPPALAGVWAKMRRAVFHRAALVAAANAYEALPPYEIRETITGDMKTIRAVATIPPPEDLALIIGDMVQNLRAALDYMAWAFALTVRAEPSDMTQFPILKKRPKDFATVPRLIDVPPSVRDIMEAMQPYQDEDAVGGWIGRHLGVLAQLSNSDKHRLLLPTQRVSVIPKYVAHSTPKGEESGLEFRIDPRYQWAEVVHPVHPGRTFEPHFEAQVTIYHADLPWRSGLEGISQMLCSQTEMVIGAFRGQWPLFRTLAYPAKPLPERPSAGH
jgi:hypothetical protein